jgi:hypothetical protein
MTKIFQIGFNKTGTVSINSFLNMNGIKSIHNDGGKLAKRMYSNAESGLSLLSGYEQFQGFTDMEYFQPNSGFKYAHVDLFKKLDQEYPNSLFILNIRDVEAWILSRKKQGQILDRTMHTMGYTEQEVEEHWRQSFYDHINNVKEHFRTNPDRLLVYKIDADKDNLLSDFLVKNGITVDKQDMVHQHKTNDKQDMVDQHKTNSKSTSDLSAHINKIRDAAIFLENEHLDISLRLMEIAASLRPEGKFIKSKLELYREKIS